LKSDQKFKEKLENKFDKLPNDLLNKDKIQNMKMQYKTCEIHSGTE
jgi:hypothetical protein